jgi:hypothetical protein
MGWSPYSWEKFLHFSFGWCLLPRDCYALNRCCPTVGSCPPFSTRPRHRAPSAVYVWPHSSSFMARGRQIEATTWLAGKEGRKPVVPVVVGPSPHTAMVPEESTSQDERERCRHVGDSVLSRTPAMVCLDYEQCRRVEEVAAWRRTPVFIRPRYSSLFLFPILLSVFILSFPPFILLSSVLFVLTFVLSYFLLCFFIFFNISP